MLRAYPSLFLLSFVLIGIVTADRLELTPYPLLVLAIICFVLTALTLSRKKKVAAGLLVGLTLGLFSGFNYSMRFTGEGTNHLRTLITEPSRCQVYGQVADWPHLKPTRTEIIIAVDSLKTAQSLQSGVVGNILLRVTDTTTVLQRGDRVTFKARLYPVEDRGGRGFDYGRYLNLKGVFASAYLPTLLNVQIDRRSGYGFFPFVDKIRSAIRTSLDLHLGDNASALARGFLIGETRDIPPHIYRMFRDSGTMHLLAVSGSNVVLVIMFVVLVMRPFWIGPTTRAVILLGVIAVFAGLSYGDPSVIRASIMAALIIGARLLRRSYNLNNIVGATALFILLVAPTQLFDVGFQLSFIVAWGLVFIVPRLTDRFKLYHDRLWYKWLIFPFIIAIVAQVCSTPVIAYYFGRIPVISLVANMIVVPMVSLGVHGILLLLTADLIWPLLGAFIGSWLDLLLNSVVWVLAAMGGEQIPVIKTGSLLQSEFGSVLVVGSYFLIVLLALAIKHQSARRIALFAIVIYVNAGLVWSVVGAVDHDRYQLECQAVPGGVAVLIRSGDIERADLVITGLSRRDYPLDERILDPWLEQLGVRRLKGVFIMSADYVALDDIIRFISKHRASALYVNRDLASSVADALASAEDSAPLLELTFFGEAQQRPTTTGIWASADRISVRLDNARVDIIRRAGAIPSDSVSRGELAVLVIGSTWRPTADDWIRLHRSGYRQIVCAKLEQPGDSVWPDTELNPDGYPPDYVRDLFHDGPVTVNIPF